MSVIPSVRIRIQQKTGERGDFFGGFKAEEIHGKPVRDAQPAVEDRRSSRLVRYKAANHTVGSAPIMNRGFHDAEADQWLVFLTNTFDFTALTIAHLYKARWKVKLFY